MRMNVFHFVGNCQTEDNELNPSSSNYSPLTSRKDLNRTQIQLLLHQVTVYSVMPNVERGGQLSVDKKPAVCEVQKQCSLKPLF